MKPLLLAALLLFAFPAAAQTPIASPGHPGWTRTTEGCFVWNPNPQAGSTASWSGGCNGSRASGKGVLIWRWSEGTQRLEGESRDGKLTGRILAVYENGNRYDGEMRDSGKSGRGVATFANGNRYDGEYRDDKRHGRGVYTSANGNRYDGEWRDGKPTGSGVFTWTDGNVFDGEWRDGKPNGPGRMAWADGTTYNGIWTNGCFRDGDRRAAVMVGLETCP